MEALVSHSASQSPYSPEVIGALAGVGVFITLLLIAWVYIYIHGGLSEILRGHRERRKAKRQVQDVEIAESATHAERVAEQAVQMKQAEVQLEGLFAANTLVGSSPPRRPEPVDLESERQAQEGPQKPSNASGAKDSLNLAIDPMSFTWGSGKTMADLYRK
ncbi:hypothetical protein C7974DRAFT_184805 [Boeremia exigua]|uniref:uncharacterized protein n=1 Tax=Boeremia exigua TaxID=749465 RepID=UPI001E8CD487|nr:uncharacterized protein C7974DRAFT_184805 [Boeremia exigua]KAH6629332.1 hypothetical protein C7974DRAFT_184805 [Boeremia exigua]